MVPTSRGMTRPDASDFGAPKSTFHPTWTSAEMMVMFRLPRSVSHHGSPQPSPRPLAMASQLTQYVVPNLSP